ncbi:MAG: tetratricopeptide repeat protein, partial [Nitrospinota bacterium]|nr:tetratricopeptide repeat protein [Nitrospinota bacterium]
FVVFLGSCSDELPTNPFPKTDAEKWNNGKEARIKLLAKLSAQKEFERKKREAERENQRKEYERKILATPKAFVGIHDGPPELLRLKIRWRLRDWLSQKKLPRYIIPRKKDPDEVIKSIKEARDGWLEDGNQIIAKRRLIRHAENGNPEAQLLLGDVYDSINLTNKLKRDAAEWYKKSADQGNIEAMDKLANAYYNGDDNYVMRDLKKRFEIHKKGAFAGSVVHQFKLGFAYLEGEGVGKNYKKALKWFKESAVIGYPPSESELGLMYAEGKGVSQSHIKALKWFRKVGEKCVYYAYPDMVKIYLSGKDIEKDLVQAHFWNDIAWFFARNFEERSIAYEVKKEQIKPGMSEEQIKTANALARKWIKKKIKNLCGNY